MASIEDRVADLLEKRLGISDRSSLDVNSSELGVNSVDAVSFLKVINQEFGANISPEEAAGFTSIRDIINHLGG